MEIINLTPHAVHIMDLNSTEIITIAPSGTVARAKTERKLIGEINGISVFSTSFGELEGLPEQREGIVYIVSALAAQAVNNRSDIFIPDDVVRDVEGRVIGCRALGKITYTEPEYVKQIRYWQN